LNAPGELLLWYVNRLCKDALGDQEIEQRILGLGQWLKDRNYVGIDVRADYGPQEISTVPAFALMGWLNLYLATEKAFYLQEAEHCLDLLLASQTPEGGWRFPYPFRDNPPGFFYACENFMTVRALLYYCEQAEPHSLILKSIQKALAFLLQEIGHQGGLFWYSKADRIRVPNISSMAANVFARASQLLGDAHFSKLAREFAYYCLKTQSKDGAYPYFEAQEMVYLPYHALEIWELSEANEILSLPELDQSTNHALEYLREYLDRWQYRSMSMSRGRRQTWLLKTPLWIAKAFQSKRQLSEAQVHLDQALRIFWHPVQRACFYQLRRVSMGPLTLEYPLLDSLFIR